MKKSTRSNDAARRKSTNNWFDKLTREQQKEYIKKHPRSVYAKKGLAKLVPKNTKTIINGIKKVGKAINRKFKAYDDGVEEVAKKIEGNTNSKTRKVAADAGRYLFNTRGRTKQNKVKNARK